MVRLIAGAIAVAWAFAGWRNLPRMTDPNSLAAGVAIAGTVLIAFWVGRRVTMAQATAVAMAKAEAWAASVASSRSESRAQVVNLINLDKGATAAAAEQFGALDRASWIGEVKSSLDEDGVVSMLEDAGGLESEYVER